MLTDWDNIFMQSADTNLSVGELPGLMNPEDDEVDEDEEIGITDTETDIGAEELGAEDTDTGADEDDIPDEGYDDEDTGEEYDDEDTGEEYDTGGEG